MADLERQTHIVYPAGPILVILHTTHKPIAHTLILDEDDLSSHLRAEKHAFFEPLILFPKLVYSLVAKLNRETYLEFGEILGHFRNLYTRRRLPMAAVTAAASPAKRARNRYVRVQRWVAGCCRC